MSRDWRAMALALAVFIRLSGSAGVSEVSASGELERAGKVLEKLADRHRAAKSIQIKFKSRVSGPDGKFAPFLKGTLRVADSGRFRLEQNKGVLVSDGIVLKQYVPENAQVIVRAAPAQPSGAAGAALSAWLGAKPLRATRNKEGMRVALEATEAGLDSLWVTLDMAKGALRLVETCDAAGNRVEYRVLSLRFGDSVRKKDFTFDAPAGAEVVDMR